MTGASPEERSAVVEQQVDARRDAFTAGRDVIVNLPSVDRPARRRDLPRDVHDFTGRQSELQRLIDIITKDSENTVVISAIDGMAGVGKTTLAVHAAHHLAALS